jgi:hypothetical protein
LVANGGGGRLGGGVSFDVSCRGEEAMDDRDCEVVWPRLDKRWAPGGGRGAGRCGTSSEMGAPAVGMVVITGLFASDLDGYGEDGDRFTGEPVGDCWTPTGGLGAARDGCIELRLGGDGGTAGIECNLPRAL